MTGRRVLLSAVVLSASCAMAHAQMFHNLAPSLLASRQALAPVRSLALGASRGAGAASGAYAAPLGGGGAGRVLVRARTDYPRDPAVSAKVRADFIASLRQRGDGHAAQAVADDFRRMDPVRLWDHAMAADGLRDTDMADALTAYVGLNWNMANHADMSSQQAAALRRAVHRAMEGDPGVARMSPGQRQELGETLMVVTNYLLADYNNALRAKDTARLADLSDLAEARMRADMNLNMRAMRIGANGAIVTG